MDVEILQRIQDWFAATTGLTTRVRDTSGRPITQVSGLTEFCSLITGAELGKECCRQSHEYAMRALRASDEPVRYDCHAGLLQIAAPIRVAGQLVAMVIVGQSPEATLSDEHVAALAQRIGVDPERLRRAAQQLVAWSDETTRTQAAVLTSIATTISQLSYRGYVLRQHLEELTALYNVSRALTSAETLQQTLDVITKDLTETLHVKACSLRLLNESKNTLDPAAHYNLSEEYRTKGPVAMGDSIYDKQAIEGGVVKVKNVRVDPNFRYREEARAEGLVSMLCMGLISHGRPIGAVRVYTGEEHEFTQGEMQLMRALASQAAIAIERARLVDELRATNARLRQMYEQVVAVQEQLIQSEKLAVIGELAAGVAHEVKNPMSAVYYAAADIKEHGAEMEPEQLREAADRIMAQAKRTTTVVDEMRGYVKPTEMEHSEAVRLGELVGDVLSLMRFDEDARGIKLINGCSDGGPEVVVHRDKIGQVLVNLVRNAMQATRPPDGEIRVSAHEEDGYAVIRVADNGEGIGEDVLPRIWDPFFSTRGRAGTGLGLDICRRIVAAHGGTVEVESKAGKGTTFAVTIPMRRE
ncbi:MAG: PocR ligand-binding domain-containing protein [Armatimonadota bacterium]|jgi:signal transduction histidine kinase/ligand-binding sensor protein